MLCVLPSCCSGLLKLKTAERAHEVSTSLHGCPRAVSVRGVSPRERERERRRELPCRVSPHVSQERFTGELRYCSLTRACCHLSFCPSERERERVACREIVSPRESEREREWRAARECHRARERGRFHRRFRCVGSEEGSSRAASAAQSTILDTGVSAKKGAC